LIVQTDTHYHHVTNISVFLSFLAAFLTQTVCLDDTTVKFEIWDTAGQERYHSLAPMYYRGAQAAIVVYDITNTVSACDYEIKTFKSELHQTGVLYSQSITS